MRIGVISDIHGNRLALEAVLADLARHGVERLVNLGDLVSGPIEPGRTVDLLMDLDIPTVRGNHERYVVERPLDRLGPTDRFVRQQLTDRQLRWIGDLPATLMLEDIFLCHGTPVSDDEPWLDNWWQGRTCAMPGEEGIAAKADGIDAPLMLCGHTHMSRAVRLRDGRLIVNPGSVGLQMNHGSPEARYAVIEREGTVCRWSFHAVPYDYEAAARLADANGFPAWREALLTGWVGAEGLF